MIVNSEAISKVSKYVNTLSIQEHFSGVIAISQHQKVLYLQCFGRRDGRISKSEQLAIVHKHNQVSEVQPPLSTSRLFFIGSITKQFTAALALMLWEQGQLDIHASIKEYLPRMPEAWQPITTFHLLNHSAGLAEHVQQLMSEENKGKPHNVDQLIALFEQEPLAFTPGQQSQYSNSGYILLGKLIESITGCSFSESLQRWLFEPLGLNDIGLAEERTPLPYGIVCGHQRVEDAIEPVMFNYENAYAAGGIFASANALLAWNHKLHAGQVIALSTVHAMQITSPFSGVFGIGGYPEFVDDHRCFSHGGLIPGFQSENRYIPNDNIALVVLSNVVQTPEASQLASQLTKILYGASAPLVIDRAYHLLSNNNLAEFKGTYAISTLQTLSIDVLDHKLIVTILNGPKYTFYPRGDDAFYHLHGDWELLFTRDSDSLVFTVKLQQQGQSLIAHKI